jgi:ribosome recycling factor
MIEKATFLKEVDEKMNKSLASFEHDLASIRTGRANVNFLDPVVIEAYGDKMPINQVATVSVAESMLLNVQVWDKTLVKAVEKAIANSNLGVTTSADGQNIRIPLPPLSEERRVALSKVAAKYGENNKIAIRNLRRDFLDTLKKAEKASDISKDILHDLTEQVQKKTDSFIAIIDTKVTSKEAEILKV